jgi:hypothetical protein
MRIVTQGHHVDYSGAKMWLLLVTVPDYTQDMPVDKFFVENKAETIFN